MDPDIFALGAHLYQQVEAGESCCTGTGCDDLDVRQGLAGELQRIGDGCGNDDCRSVLIVVEDRDVHLGAQLALDFETFGRLDVFEIDAAEGGLECRNGGDHIVDAGRVDFDIEDVDIGKFLEEDGFAFHHRLRRQRADVAETENGGAV